MVFLILFVIVVVAVSVIVLAIVVASVIHAIVVGVVSTVLERTCFASHNAARSSQKEIKRRRNKKLKMQVKIEKQRI